MDKTAPKPWNELWEQTLGDLAGQYSDVEIAKGVGKTRVAVRYWLGRQDWPFSKPRSYGDLRALARFLSKKENREVTEEEVGIAMLVTWRKDFERKRRSRR